MNFVYFSIYLLSCMLPPLICLGICCAGLLRFCPRHRRGRLFLAALCWTGLGTGAAYLLIMKSFFRHWDVLTYVLKPVFLGNFSYESAAAHAQSLAIFLPVSVGWGFLFVVLLKLFTVRSPGEEDRRRALIPLLRLLVLAELLIGAGIFCFGEAGPHYLAVNEVYDRGKDRIGDNLTFGDYVELYNKGRLKIELSGLGLTDDPEEPFKYCLYEGVIYPGEAAVVYPETFGLSAGENETVFLCDRLGRVIDRAQAADAGRYHANARVPDGTGAFSVRGASPGALNQETIRFSAETIAAPVLSAASGFYEEEFELELSHREGREIYYTLDGSIPAEDAAVYREPIRVHDRKEEPQLVNSPRYLMPYFRIHSDVDYSRYDLSEKKAFVIRAACKNDKGELGEIATGVYFIGEMPGREDRIVSLVMDPSELFGDNGIAGVGKEYRKWLDESDRDIGREPVANFLKHGEQWERAAEYQLFEDGMETGGQSVGIRLQGASSREHFKKRFRLTARDFISGDRYFDESPFSVPKVHSMLLRPGFEHALFSLISRDRDLVTQEPLPACAYMNGHLVDRLYLTEHWSEDLIAQHTGLDRTNIEMLNVSDNWWDTKTFPQEEIERYLSSHDMKSEEDLRGFERIMDLQSFLNALCINLYLGNADVFDNKNLIYWRSVTEDPDVASGDCRWRVALSDLDLYHGAYQREKEKYGWKTYAEVDPFRAVPYHTGIGLMQGPLTRRLMVNEEVQKRLVLTFMDTVNTIFTEENCLEKMEQLGKGTLDWNDGFLRNRRNYILPYLEDYMQLEGAAEPLTVRISDENGGSVLVNTAVPSFTNGAWQGYYYTDYPVTLTAKAAEGYEFAGWKGSGSGDGDRRVVSLEEGGAEIEAVFIRKESE